jgi:hypothetical protein
MTLGLGKAASNRPTSFTPASVSLDPRVDRANSLRASEGERTAAFRCTSITSISKRPTLPGLSALLQTRKLIHKLIHKIGGRLGTS